jgi:hypothetical protein
MSEHYHTPYEDGTTEYKDADMNVPLGELDQAINDIRGPKKYDFMGQYLGDVLNSNALLMQGITGRYMVLVAGATGSKLFVGTAPAAQSVFTIKRNGVQVGTITVGAGGSWGAFSVASPVAFYNGDLLELYGPNPADASLQDVSWNIILQRVDALDMTTSTTTTTTTSTTTV